MPRVTSRYDLRNRRLARLTYPDATTVSYEYNASGELARVIDSQSSILNSPSSIFQYDRREDGKITALHLPKNKKTKRKKDARHTVQLK